LFEKKRGKVKERERERFGEKRMLIYLKRERE
jgi:hypothetical protein